MGQIQFGYILPVNRMDSVLQTQYVADLNRALTLISGHFDSAWVIDHLQGDILEGFTTLTYMASLYPN